MFGSEGRVSDGRVVMFLHNNSGCQTDTRLGDMSVYIKSEKRNEKSKSAILRVQTRSLSLLSPLLLNSGTVYLPLFFHPPTI